MRETPEDLKRRQTLLDRSIRGAGTFLRDSFGCRITRCAIIAHGRAEVLGPDDPDFPVLEGAFHEARGESVLAWGEGVYVRVEAEKFYTFARYPDLFPGGSP